MRLKEPPKKALQIIDYLISIGFRAIRTGHFTPDKDKRYQTWFDKAKDYLSRVFLDFAPVYKVLKCENKEDIGYVSSFDRNRVSSEMAEQITQALDVLVEYYNVLADSNKSPVLYFPDKAEIWLYDICCSLVPESNESELCKYMFNLGIGEWVEMAKIFKNIVGEEYDPKAKNRNVVVNALDGVNRKTKDAFDFPLLKKRKSVVALAIPSRFILDRK